MQKHKINPPLKPIFYTKSSSQRREKAFSHFSSLHTIYFQIISPRFPVVVFCLFVCFCLGVGDFACLLFRGFFVGVILVERGL